MGNQEKHLTQRTIENTEGTEKRSFVISVTSLCNFFNPNQS